MTMASNSVPDSATFLSGVDPGKISKAFAARKLSSLKVF